MINTTFLKIQLTLIIYLVNKHYSKINWCLWAEQNQVTGYFTSKCYFKDLQVFFDFVEIPEKANMSIIGHLNEQKLVLVMTRYLISKPELDLDKLTRICNQANFLVLPQTWLISCFDKLDLMKKLITTVAKYFCFIYNET